MNPGSGYIMLELTAEEASAVAYAITERISRLHDIELAVGEECFKAEKDRLRAVRLDIKIQTK